MLRRVCFFLSLLTALLLPVVDSLAGISRPEFRLQQTYRYELKKDRDKHRYYIVRLSMSSVFSNALGKELFKITPFFEARRNTREGHWERREVGLEAGKDILPWLYFGQAVEQVWAKEDYRYYGDYESRDFPETETRILLSHNLLPDRFIKLKGFILDEYTYDLVKGRGMRNEAAVGMTLPIGKYLEAQIDWRHIDRIHYYDSDTFEGSLTLIF